MVCDSELRNVFFLTVLKLILHLTQLVQKDLASKIVFTATCVCSTVLRCEESAGRLIKPKELQRPLASQLPEDRNTLTEHDDLNKLIWNPEGLDVTRLIWTLKR